MNHNLSKQLGALLLLFSVCSAALAQQQRDAPEIFTYAELTTLYEQETLPPPLAEKLNRLLTTPFVDNSYRSATPVSLARSPQLGEFLRVAFWNIERGLEYEAIEAAFTSEAQFAALLDNDRYPAGSEARREALAQAALLRAADVIVLNEVDWGMKRSEYRNVAADLAARLRMNYAFGAQFVELTPVWLSGEPARPNAEENEILDLIKVDPTRYKGLHGIAILSRFPLENVRLVPFAHQPYDWYRSERQGASIVERGRRELAEQVFLERTLREVRRGGRAMLLADIADARFPAGRVTIVATHLESRTTPAHRIRQLQEMLAGIREIRHPVIVAGDMNTSTEDTTPTSLQRELVRRFGNPQFWARKAISYALGFGLVEDFLIGGAAYARRRADPTVRHIPFFAPNPSRRFFTTLEDFRFADGGAFDFRGDPARSIGNSGETLGNSNERGGMGFITTYQVNRPISFVGRLKLDWIFVKPARLSRPTDRRGSYRFAPHFGRTLVALNEVIEGRISDHRPLLVDLPLGEPPLAEERRRR